MTGTALAMVFPDTSGLDQPMERTLYWIQVSLITDSLMFFIYAVYLIIYLQHYLIQLVPFFLLIKDDFSLYHLVSFRNIMIANWITLLLHWTAYEGVDVMFHINVEFFLCATPAMASGISIMPSYLVWPSYRRFEI